MKAFVIVLVFLLTIVCVSSIFFNIAQTDTQKIEENDLTECVDLKLKSPMNILQTKKTLNHQEISKLKYMELADDTN